MDETLVSTLTLLLLLAVVVGGILPGLLGLALAGALLVPDSALSSGILVIAILGAIFLVGQMVGVALEGSGEMPHTAAIRSTLTLCCIGMLGGTSAGRTFITDALVIAADPLALARYSVYLTVVAGAALTVSSLVSGGILAVSFGFEFVARSLVSPGVSVAIPWGAMRVLSWMGVIGLGCNTIGSLIVQECAPLSIVRKVAEL